MNWFDIIFEAKVKNLEPVVWKIVQSSHYQHDLENMLMSATIENEQRAVKLKNDEIEILKSLKTGRIDPTRRPHKIIVKGKSTLGSYQSSESEIWDIHLLSAGSKYVLLVAKFPKKKTYILITIGEEAHFNW